MGSSHPDADLHPRATAAAAKIVSEHENNGEPLVLYSGWFCPFVQRAWVTLEEKGIPYQYQEINPYHKDPEFLKLNPRGLVPTLGCPQQDGDTKPLIESNVICEYLDETYKDHPLYPTNTFDKAKMKISIDYVGTRIIPAFHRFLQHTEKSPYSIEDARKEFLNTLITWIKDASPEGPFFAGKELQMVDIAMAPWAVRLWIFDHFKAGGLGIPEKGQGGEDEELWERWRTWSQAVEERPSIANTLSEKEHYLPIYQRYAEDRAQSELAKATRQGRGVP